MVGSQPIDQSINAGPGQPYPLDVFYVSSLWSTEDIIDDPIIIIVSSSINTCLLSCKKRRRSEEEQKNIRRTSGEEEGGEKQYQVPGKNQESKNKNATSQNRICSVPIDAGAWPSGAYDQVQRGNKRTVRLVLST